MKDIRGFATRLIEACDENPSIPKMGIGVGRLNYLREALALRGVKVENQSVSRWVNGGAVPRDDKLIPLAAVLGVTPEWLRFGAGEKRADHKPLCTPICHRFLLRPDMEVKFELPADLTQKEADRLARMICSIPLA